MEDLKRFPGNKQKYSGSPFIVEKELKYNHTKKKYPDGMTIFVCNCHDLFAEEIHGTIIRKILFHATRFKNNTYLFQTKNPGRFLNYLRYFSGMKTILCTTIESNRNYDGTKAPSVLRRAQSLKSLGVINLYDLDTDFKINVTIEPIMDFDFEAFSEILDIIDPDMVSIGADSKRCGLPEPSPEKVERLISWLDGWTEVHLKPNLERLRA